MLQIRKPVIVFGVILRKLSTTAQSNYKVAVVGAAGGIGQPLSLLLKLNEMITHLALYDIAKVTPGVAIDLSHIDTSVKVTGYMGPEQLGKAIENANVVVVPAGMPRKPGMSRDDLFKVNASIVHDIANAIAKYCPQTVLAIITNPINSMVPIAAEVLMKAGKFNANRVLGVTTLDVVRSCTFIGEINEVDPRTVSIPVIGGHSGITIIPLLSHSKPAVNLWRQRDIDELIKRIQEAGTEVVQAKAGGGSATLSMAHAGARFVGSVLKGLDNEKDVVECAYMKSQIGGMAEYFANPVLLGRNGVEKNLGVGCLNEYEEKLVAVAIPELIKNIESGKRFVCTSKINN